MEVKPEPTLSIGTKDNGVLIKIGRLKGVENVSF